MILRKWHPGIEPMDFSAELKPVWVDFIGVPPEVISPEGISWLESQFGKPVNKFVRSGFNVRICIMCADISLIRSELRVDHEELEPAVIQVKVLEEIKWSHKRGVKTYRPVHQHSEAAADMPSGNGSKSPLGEKDSPEVVSGEPAGEGVSEVFSPVKVSEVVVVAESSSSKKKKKRKEKKSVEVVYDESQQTQPAGGGTGNAPKPPQGGAGAHVQQGIPESSEEGISLSPEEELEVAMAMSLKARGVSVKDKGEPDSAKDKGEPDSAKDKGEPVKVAEPSSPVASKDGGKDVSSSEDSFQLVQTKRSKKRNRKKKNLEYAGRGKKFDLRVVTRQMSKSQYEDFDLEI
ncbi:hypothetical protein LINPERPRIM_LOCUS21165 [Linum perenne]